MCLSEAIALSKWKLIAAYTFVATSRRNWLSKGASCMLNAKLPNPADMSKAERKRDDSKSGLFLLRYFCLSVVYFETIIRESRMTTPTSVATISERLKSAL